MSGFSEPVFVSYLQLSRMGQLSATLAALYDHAISIDEELELIWGRPGHTAKMFYFLTRYCGNTVVVRKSQLHLQTWATAVPAWVVQMILQFRLYAMYNRSRRILFFMASCFLIELAAAMSFALYEDVEVIAVRMDNLTGCLVIKSPKFAYGTWASILAFEGVLFFLALYKMVLHLSRLQTHWTRDNVTDVLLRDNMFYFLVIFITYCMTIVSWFTLPPILMQILGSYTITVTCTLGSRLILNIRRASYHHQECVDTKEIEYQLHVLPGDQDESTSQPDIPSSSQAEGSGVRQVEAGTSGTTG
ncbi:hypothetical protein JAAARDRAFT_42884 [Jaapia argillacea MUCL 33604]|uniref:DUF6533 domain-containing protein n=1 Tax=Jaapia argillacea MUCL 33604 TaxID=933084 RepID=A0A067P406_9AGAM|nr:hypothetical protein JAAARDRAFT_42884 [Jaapia argillacea MUCL 33604]